MRTVLTLARHDLRLVLRDRAAAWWLFLAPVVFATFLGLVTGGGGRPAAAKARLTVVDRDGGFLARAFLADLASERLDLVEIAPGEQAATANKVRTLVIPEGFTEAIVLGQQATVRLELDPDTGGEAALVVQARIVAASVRLIARLVELDLPPGTTLTEEALASLAEPEDLVRVESRFAGQSTTTPHGFAQSIPGNAVMFVLLVALTFGAASISAERGGGQLRRLVTAPTTHAQIVLGKIVGRFAVAAVQISVLVVVGVVAHRLFGVHIGDHVFALWLILLVFGAVAAPLGVALGAWLRDPDRAANVGVLCTLIMAALGGCWWPLEVVSRPLQRLALAFPTGWAMQALHQVISFGHGLGDVVTELGVLLGFAAVLTAIAVRSLRVE